MSKLTNRAAYLRGLADGMNIDREKNENKLMLEMLNLLDEMVQKIKTLDNDLGELEAYVEDIDSDLGDVEEILFEDEDSDCDCCDDDCDCCGEFDDSEELSFDCPHCGETVMVKAADIDYAESPVCEHCGQPFFTDLEDEEDSDDQE